VRFSFLALFLARLELELELVAIQKIPVRQEGSLRSGIQASPLLAQTGRECLKIALPVISRLFPFAAARCFSLSPSPSLSLSPSLFLKLMKFIKLHRTFSFKIFHRLDVSVSFLSINIFLSKFLFNLKHLHYSDDDSSIALSCYAYQGYILIIIAFGFSFLD